MQDLPLIPMHLPNIIENIAAVCYDVRVKKAWVIMPGHIERQKEQFGKQVQILCELVTVSMEYAFVDVMVKNAFTVTCHWDIYFPGRLRAYADIQARRPAFCLYRNRVIPGFKVTSN